MAHIYSCFTYILMVIFHSYVSLPEGSYHTSYVFMNPKSRLAMENHCAWQPWHMTKYWPSAIILKLNKTESLGPWSNIMFGNHIKYRAARDYLDVLWGVMGCYGIMWDHMGSYGIKQRGSGLGRQLSTHQISWARQEQLEVRKRDTLKGLYAAQTKHIQYHTTMINHGWKVWCNHGW